MQLEAAFVLQCYSLNVLDTKNLPPHCQPFSGLLASLCLSGWLAVMEALWVQLWASVLKLWGGSSEPYNLQSTNPPLLPQGLEATRPPSLKAQVATYSLGFQSQGAH